MATNPNDSVNHIPYSGSSVGNGDIGLTKREYFAAMALQGFCANAFISKSLKNQEYTALKMSEMITHASVQYADNLIAELNKEVDNVPK